MNEIKNQTLIRNSSFINGHWVSSENQFEVINPANKTVISSVHQVSKLQVKEAITAAYDALSIWQEMGAATRKEKLFEWQRLIRENIDDLASILTLEQGKPLTEAKAEIQHSANYIRLYAELAEDVCESVEVPSDDHQIGKVVRRPVGVVGAITPWNFPCSMVLRKAGAALAAGCSVVVKPSELTPHTALALAQLSIQASLPAGVINVVVGTNAKAIGKLLTQDHRVAKISFTGSTKVGKKLLKQCAKGVKRVSMELGGNAPFIVFSNADLELAVDGAIKSRFRNSGQTCVCANRFIIQDSIADKFIEKTVIKLKNLVISDGFDPACDLGPLINIQALEKMETILQKAKEEKAKVVIGGNSLKREGYFFEATLIDGVTPEMKIFSTEIFGPILSITRFHSTQEALNIANESRQGLAGYLFSQNKNTIKLFQDKLQVGMLGINEVNLSNHHAPFGGIKESGMGREGGRYGLEDYLDYQYICQTKTPA